MCDRGDIAEKMYHMMDFCNGEVRIMACRYGSGFMCVISLIERHDDAWWERWEDMVGGDNDYFNARDYLEGKQNQAEDRFGFGYGSSPEGALDAAKRAAVLANGEIL